MTFDHPWLLMLFPLMIGFFWLVMRRSYAGLHPATLRMAFFVRCVLALLLVLVIAGAHLVKKTDKLATIFVLDVSHSMRPDQRAASLDYIRKALDEKRPGDSAGLVVFGRTAFLENSPADNNSDFGDIRPAVVGDATNISEALRLASSAFPSGYGKKIVLISDGDENIGSAEEQIDDLRVSGVRVDVATTGLDSEKTTKPEAMLEGVSLPARTSKSAPFQVRVVVSSSVPQDATLSLQRDGRPIIKQQVRLKPGKNAFVYQEKIDQTGFHKYDATVLAVSDSIPENNHGAGYISVQGRPRVLYITDMSLPGIQSLRDAMAAQKIDVDVQPPGALPASVAAIASYDTVVLSDVSAEEVGAQQMSALEEATKHFGVGLGMIGGPSSYSAGGYEGTPIETALPVSMEIKDKKRFPTVAVAMVIEDLEEPSLVNMSIEAAKKTVDLLEPTDQVGVEDCNGVWRIPMQYVTNKAAIKNQMQNLNGMNDPPSYDDYLIEAARVLSQTNAQVKHIMFLGDGDATYESGGNMNVLSQIKSKGITVSTIVTGADQSGVKFMQDMAKAGGGQSYVVEKPEDLPSTLLKDQQSVSKLRIIEKPFLVRAAVGDEVTGGMDWAGSPPLLGYNVATAKPGANVSLSAPDHGDPVFAYWRYGLGRTFAFTSDDRAHWGIHWLPWLGYPRFWAQALRWSLRSNTNADFQATVDNEGGKGHIVVDAFTQNGGFINNAGMKAEVVSPGLAGKQVTLTQTAPGRYEGTFDADETGAYMVNVRKSGDGGSGPAPSQTVGLVVPYSPEYRTLTPNLAILTRLAESTGGHIQPDPAKIFRDLPAYVVGVIDLIPTLLALAAALFLLDIAVRRLALRPAEVKAGARQGIEAAEARIDAYRKARNARPTGPSSEQMGRLLDRKTSARAATLPDEEQTTTERLLGRKAAASGGDTDESFPRVASLQQRPKPKSSDKSPQTDNAYTSRLLDAKRRARERDDD